MRRIVDVSKRYALAILATVVALFLRRLLTPLLGENNPYHTMWLAIVFSAWYCGLGPSIVTAVSGMLGVWYWFLPPVGSLAIQNKAEIFGAIWFLIFSGVIIALGEANRRVPLIQSKLAAIVDSSDDAIISKNLDGVITSWNGGAVRIFGWTEEEAIGKSITLIIPPELRSEETRILERLKAGERIDHFETVRVTKSGDRLNVSLTISPLRNPGGRIVGASKVARDVTAYKQAAEKLRSSQEQIRESAERFQAFFHSAAVGAARADVETGRFLEVNDTFCRMTGYGRDELQAMTFLDITHPDDKGVTVEHQRLKLRDPNHNYELDKRYVRKDGQTIWVRVAINLVASERDTPYYVGVVIDITDRKKAEEYLRESEKRLRERVLERTLELQQRNEELRNLSARLQQIRDEERRALARELHDSTGQSLAVLSMNLDVLKRKVDQSSPDIAALAMQNKVIVDQISTELRTISYLLHPPLLDEIGLEAALRWYAEGLAERSKITMNLKLNLGNGAGRLSPDLETALFRIVQECLTNIHRHSGSPTATIRLRSSSDKIILEVIDQGAGMPPEKLDQIAAGRLPGVGLRGMRERIQGFHGELDVLSGANGTTIRVVMPMGPGPASND
jgi:PAS domain S-box-containing protein